MPIYVVAPRSGILKAGVERSPCVALVTDAVKAKSLPDVIRATADHIVTEDPAALRDGTVPPGSDAVIVWHEGDCLTHGSAAGIRRDLFHAGRRYMVPVHYPGMAEMDVDLIGIEPRWFSAAPAQEQLRSEARIAANPSPSKSVREALKNSPAPWAALSLTLLDEQKQSRSALDRLKQLWKQGKLKPLLAALVLRNLIVLLLRDGEFAKAEELIHLGMKAYPDYGELQYLAAVSCIRQGKPSQAVPFLEQVQQKTGTGYVGSGGESSYRAHWLMGTISASVGRYEKAFNYLFPAVMQQPAFRPAVETLLELRLPSERAYKLQWPFCELVRRQPEYLQPVLDFLIRHRQLAAAERLLRTVDSHLDPSSIRQLRSSPALQLDRRLTSRRPGIILQGPFQVNSSFARINREIARPLLQSKDLDAALEPHGFASIPTDKLAYGPLLEQGLRHQPNCLDLTVRLTWPPDFRRPPEGNLACILPWEYHAVPRKWVEEIDRSVAELWVPSCFVRDAFVDGGVPADRVHVLPLGVDSTVFKPEGPRTRPKGCRNFVFLFVGGLIARKGVDLLLAAYAEAFSAEDDVTLILKEIGSTSFYQHNTLREQIQGWKHNRSVPHMLQVTEELDEAELAALYRGADAFVLPYRGEGFGLPLLEAAACGKPVVTTDLGPAREFCVPQATYLIPAQVAQVPDQPPPLGEFTSELTWFEPDVGELARILRNVYDNADEMARQGLTASEKIRNTYNWVRVGELYMERIRKLVQDGEHRSSRSVSSHFFARR